MSDRVVCQFGLVQSTPLDVIVPRTAHRPMDGRGKDRLDEHLCVDILGSPETIPEWEVEKGYLDWFFTMSHPYRVVMTRAHVRSVLMWDHGSLADWSFVEAVLSSAQPPLVGPFGQALDFPFIYERGESSRTSAAVTEADMRETERAEFVVIVVERVTDKLKVAMPNQSNS
ncbi:hypothetical protein V2J09_022333 [Rumex salicifolius]